MLERENKELRRANEILKTKSAFFAQGASSTANGSHKRLHRPVSGGLRGQADSRQALQVAPSAYRRHAARARSPALRSARARRDDLLMPEIRRIWQANLGVYYGQTTVWRQRNRETLAAARLPGGAIDEKAWIAGGKTRQDGAHHDPRCQGSVSDGSCSSPVQGGQAE